MKNTIYILIIIVLALGLYISFTHNKYSKKDDMQTVVDTIFVNTEARIDTVWLTKTKLDTIIIETVLQGDTIFTTHTDTILITESDIIASTDTVFVSSDSLVKSHVFAKYSYNNKSFFIRNILSHKIGAQNSTIESRFPLGAILYTSGNESSLELGFGLQYKVSRAVNVFAGYSTSNRIMIGFGVSLP